MLPKSIFGCFFALATLYNIYFDATLLAIVLLLRLRVTECLYTDVSVLVCVRGQHPVNVIPSLLDVMLVRLVRENSGSCLNQPRDNISSVCPGSASGHPPGMRCPEHLMQEVGVCPSPFFPVAWMCVFERGSQKQNKRSSCRISKYIKI